MIEVENVSKKFGSVHAVTGVSFSLRPGQIAGLLGHNGAGKTTTIRMVTTCLMPDAGLVRVGGHDTQQHRRGAMRLLGYLPEATPLYPEMRVTDYLHFRGRLWSMSRRDRTAAVERAIDRCWLKEMRSRRIVTLSKGYKQRVGLASALLHDPPALILDEPTNGLDPTQVHETRSLVRELARDRTVLLSSHVLSEVERLCDRVVIIAGGTLRADGTPRELARRTGGAGILLEVASLTPERADVLASALAALQGVTGLRQQRTPEGLWSATLTTDQGADDGPLRDHVSHTLLSMNIPARTLRAQQPSLEQVFATLSAGSLTQEASHPTVPPMAAPPDARTLLRQRLDQAASLRDAAAHTLEGRDVEGPR